MTFALHPNLQSKRHIIDLPLCQVFIENEKHYPWLILVPKKNGIKKLIDLSIDDQMIVLQEMNIVQKILWNLFSPSQINVAALGNKTPQLHIHIIARFETDPAWPHTVWDHHVKELYSHDDFDKITISLQQAFQSALNM
jgi:diadenosine tetraphosphate (Ap4A) HIT family hydrolase